MITAQEISKIITQRIKEWHDAQAKRPADYVIVPESIKQIRKFGDHRDDINVVINDLVDANCEMWHEEDKVRSENDQTVLKAIRNINPLNQHRNDLIEEIDEIVTEKAKEIK